MTSGLYSSFNADHKLCAEQNCDVDHNFCMDDQDNHREQHDDVDHNPVRGLGE